MNTAYLKLVQTEEDWQALFAYQVFHRQAEEWLKMRWGFNAGALLDEALDRYKLFIDSQTLNEAEFHAGVQPNRTLALRGINLPGVGVQMSLLGKVNAKTREEAQEAGGYFAREIYSTFPHDFILVPAGQPVDFDKLSGIGLVTANSSAAQIQRGAAFIQSTHGRQYFSGLWQASSRSNEQIWRALSAMPDQVLFNILIQPSFFYDGEKQSLLDAKKNMANAEQNIDSTSAYIPWAENFIERRLAAWKKFFLVQVHIIANGLADESLLRSIGSALTRDEKDIPLPGFQIKRPDSDADNSTWCEKILSLDLIPASRIEDLADSDETYAVFRFPYFPEAGVPGTNFINLQKESPPAQNGQEQ